MSRSDRFCLKPTDCFLENIEVGNRVFASKRCHGWFLPWMPTIVTDRFTQKSQKSKADAKPRGLVPHLSGSCDHHLKDDPGLPWLARGLGWFAQGLLRVFIAIEGVLSF